MTDIFSDLKNKVKIADSATIWGKVTSVKGMLIECTGIENVVCIGAFCRIQNNQGKFIPCEVVGFKKQNVLLLPFWEVIGIGLGSKVFVSQERISVQPSERWLGRVINAFGEPIDDKGPLPLGNIAYPLKTMPPPANKRNRLGAKVDLGVKVLNVFTSCCKGQRMGIFAGSGVGKSMTTAMITKYTNADIVVVGLIGERGREVKEFIEDYLGEEGLKRAVIVVSTSDESALMRRQAAYLTMTVAEYFRDREKNVMCFMDSVTRFALAQREIGLAAGEPPTTKGFTPTVFNELPKLLERAGPGINNGAITAFFNVLVEGDDMNEPISDAVRGILDGHIILDRHIAERGRYPAVNVLRSLSRSMPKCNNDEQNELVAKARNLLSTYNDMAEMIRLGAYRKGSDKEVDRAIEFHEPLEQFQTQNYNEYVSLEDGYQQLKQILSKDAAKTPEEQK